LVQKQRLGAGSWELRVSTQVKEERCEAKGKSHMYLGLRQVEGLGEGGAWTVAAEKLRSTCTHTKTLTGERKRRQAM